MAKRTPEPHSLAQKIAVKILNNLQDGIFGDNHDRAMVELRHYRSDIAETIAGMIEGASLPQLVFPRIDEANHQLEMSRHG